MYHKRFIRVTTDEDGDEIITGEGVELTFDGACFLFYPQGHKIEGSPVFCTAFVDRGELMRAYEADELNSIHWLDGPNVPW